MGLQVSQAEASPQLPEVETEIQRYKTAISQHIPF